MKDENNKRSFPHGLDGVVLHIILRHKGEKNGIKRTYLLNECNRQIPCDDSEMRLAIQFLREQGYMICNYGRGTGYFLAGTVEEFSTWIDKYTDRALSIFKARDAMYKTAKAEFDFN